MKKCPFCAEQIQDEAIKCKHCGEWLSDKGADHPEVSSAGIPSAQEVPSVRPEIDQRKEDIREKADQPEICFPKEASPEEAPKVRIEIEQKKERTKRERMADVDSFLEKEKIRGGYGWIVMLVFYLALAVGTKPHFTNPSFKLPMNLVMILGLLITAFLYPWIRRQLLIKKKLRTLRDTSVLSAFLTYLVLGAFLGVSYGLLSRIDMNAYSKKFDKMKADTEKKIVSMNQEEERLWKAYSDSPRSISDVAILKDILELLGKKEEISIQLVDAYENIVKYAENETLKEKYSKLKSSFLEYYATYRKAINLMIESYSNDDETLTDEANKLLEKKDTISQETAKLYIDFLKAQEIYIKK